SWWARTLTIISRCAGPKCSPGATRDRSEAQPAAGPPQRRRDTEAANAIAARTATCVEADVAQKCQRYRLTSNGYNRRGTRSQGRLKTGGKVLSFDARNDSSEYEVPGSAARPSASYACEE